MKNNELKVKHLCAYCKNHIAICDTKKENVKWSKVGDDVVECDIFEVVSMDEIHFLKRCKNTLRLLFPGDTKVKIDFTNCKDDIQLNAMVNILKELFKEF